MKEGDLNPGLRRSQPKLDYNHQTRRNTTVQSAAKSTDPHYGFLMCQIGWIIHSSSAVTLELLAKWHNSWPGSYPSVSLTAAGAFFFLSLQLRLCTNAVWCLFSDRFEHLRGIYHLLESERTRIKSRCQVIQAEISQRLKDGLLGSVEQTFTDTRQWIYWLWFSTDFFLVGFKHHIKRWTNFRQTSLKPCQSLIV